MTLSNEIIAAIEKVPELKNLHKNDRVAAIGAISFALKNEAVMKAILASVKGEEWVDVNERLPDKDGHFLVIAPQSYPKNCMVVVAEFDSDAKMFYSESSDYSIPDATYWHTLPTPPKTK